MFDDFYGLTGKPFQLTPDPAFHYRSAAHAKALSYLGYGLSQGEGVIVITGEAGSGKSTLVTRLLGTIDPQCLTVGQVANSKCDDEQVAQGVAQAFGLETAGQDKAGALGVLENFLHGEARAGRRCLLIVDDAQNLSVEALEELRLLSNLQLGKHKLLQTLLVGQPEFRATLLGHEALEHLRQRVIAAHRLEPMERAEIEPYLAHRLAQVGWTGNPQFDQRVFAEVHQVSGGIPRRVNQIANRLLLLGAVERRTRIDAVMLKVVLDEMAAEQVFPEAPPMAIPAPCAPDGAMAPHWSEPRIDRGMIEALRVEHDAQIAELQQAVVELANQHDSAGTAAVRPEIEALTAQIAGLEARVAEQDRAIREMLTMLIEWVEGDMGQSRAA